MRDRLRARGKSWDEFIELLANVRLDEMERKAREAGGKGGAGMPLRPPAALIPKEPPKVRRRQRGAPIQ